MIINKSITSSIPSGINNPEHPVILFIPEAGIYPYSRGLAVLGDAITRQGGKVFITHDTGQMLSSPLAAGRNTSNYQKTVDKRINDILENYQFSLLELSDFVDKKLMKEINTLVNGEIHNLKEIKYRGFSVGEMAEFDFILRTKYPYYPNLSPAHKVLYSQFIKNTALSIAIADRICEQYKPSLFLTFNEYAQSQGVRYSAERHGVRFMAVTYPVNFNIDASRFSLWQSSYRYWSTNHVRKWNGWKKIPVSNDHIEASWKDSVYRMYSRGSHIFSSSKERNPAEIFNNLGLDPKRKTIVVYTSSQDERSCGAIALKIWGEKDSSLDAFSSQIEWLGMLKDFSRKRNDVQIVVRVHPREGTKRKGFESHHLRQLKNKFKKSTSNFIIVWPDDPISSYDLMEMADACLISWSTVGLEAVRVGVPVLSCVGNIYYPNDNFINIAVTRREYEKKLSGILETKFTWEHLTKAVRFYHWRTFIPSLDLEKTVPREFDDDSVWPKVNSVQARVVNSVLSGEQDTIEYNLRKWKERISGSSIGNEKKAMKLGIRYFLDNVFYPPQPERKKNFFQLVLGRLWREMTGKNLKFGQPQKVFEDYRLSYKENVDDMDAYIKRTAENPKLRYIVGMGSEAILVHNGKILRRMSPMVVRLARLHESN